MEEPQISIKSYRTENRDGAFFRQGKHTPFECFVIYVGAETARKEKGECGRGMTMFPGEI